MGTGAEHLREERSWLYVGDRRAGVAVTRRADLEAPAPVAVLCHGFKGFMDWGFFPPLRRAFAEAGFVTVAMNTSGCGVGDDPLAMDDEDAFFHDTYSRQLEDIAAVRRFARGLDGVDPSREALFGHSRGGGMMLISAAEEAPARIAVWAAIDDADRFGEEAKKVWRATGVLEVPNGRTGQIHRMSVAGLDDLEANAERLDILAQVGRIDAPLLVVHGDADPTVEVEAARRIAARARHAELEILAGEGHAFGARHPMESLDEAPGLVVAARRTVEFLRRA